MFIFKAYDKIYLIMTRVNNAVARHKKHKKILNAVKGHRGRAHKCIKIAKQSLIKAHQYNYVSRKVRKRSYRSLWIMRLNSAARSYGMNYSLFINKINNICTINRKTLSQVFIKSSEAMKNIMGLVSNNISSAS